MRKDRIHEFWKASSIFPVRIYRSLVSPLIKPRCIYYPSCSEYFEQAVTKYGLIRGSLKGALRVARCNPFAKGGYDPLA